MTEPITIDIPGWIDALAAAYPEPFDTDAGQMRLCIALARENVARGGGPFGAAVFEGARLIAAGVNRVLDSGLSLAHAEVVALARAQRVVPGLGIGHAAGRYRLVTSAEPCCQCFGAFVWSGVHELLCGATTADVEAVGFDEGPKPSGWVEVLRRRNVLVCEEVEREAAREVLRAYAERGGTIYGRR
jgi:tRNA(Arg) A34 adenosine deaminase TadA